MQELNVTVNEPKEKLAVGSHQFAVKNKITKKAAILCRLA